MYSVLFCPPAPHLHLLSSLLLMVLFILSFPPDAVTDLTLPLSSFYAVLSCEKKNTTPTPTTERCDRTVTTPALYSDVRSSNLGSTDYSEVFSESLRSMPGKITTGSF